MKEALPSINERLARRIAELRAERNLSLETLANKCGVSRSMISLIELGQSNPTAVLLEKLAAGLNVSLASLFDAPAADAQTASRPVARREDQPQWQDPASGYIRRNVSPPGMSQPMQIVEVLFPPGRRVAFDAVARDVKVHQQIWVLQGTIDITVGKQSYRLRKGDCLAMQLDQPTMFHNPTRKTTRYAVIIASASHPKK